VVLAAVGDVAGGEVDRKRGDSEDVFAVSTEIVSEAVVPRTGAGLVGDLASGLAPGLPPDFEFRSNGVGLGLELTPRLVAPLKLDLELVLASGFETSPVLDPAELAPAFSSVFSSVFLSMSKANFAPNWDVVTAVAD
jgi:hypothetical protein